MIRLAIILPTFGLPLAYATIGNTYGNWNAEVSPQYGGNCYSDLVGNMRTLWRIAQGVSNGAMTIEMCLDACGSQGFNIAGVEYSKECWCGNSIQGENGPLPSSSCNMACIGDETEICGGSATMNLWVMNNFNFTHGPAGILQSYGNYQFMQCWDDYFANFRVLAHRPSNPPPGHDMTVAGCINACAADGYSSAGLEYASECFCDNKVYPIGQSDNSNCNMPCSGDASEICGGPNRLLAYFNPSSTSTSSTSTGTSTSSTV